MKKRLTQSEEFEILKLVLDKILWLGFAVMGYGFFLMVTQVDSIIKGLSFLFGGAVILVILMYLLIKEYEIIK